MALVIVLSLPSWPKVFWRQQVTLGWFGCGD